MEDQIELYNCDFRDLGDLEERFGDYILVTDPPFNMGYRYRTYKDRMIHDDYVQMIADLILGKKSVIIHYPEMLHEFSIETGMKPNRVVSWVYPSNTLRQHRDIAFYNVDPDFTKVRQPYKDYKDKRIQRLVANGSKGAKIYDWWNIDQVKNKSPVKTIHPCQMPLEVMKRTIGILPDDVTIIDPFMGSGTTGIAVRLLNEEEGANRRFIGIEIDKEYYELCKKRIIGEQYGSIN